MRPITLVCGHYGVGKTNFTLNLALAAAAHAEVCVVDLDIVNPYFRSSEYAGALEASGVKTVSPVMAGSSLDSPSLSAQVDGAIAWAREFDDACLPSRNECNFSTNQASHIGGVGRRGPKRPLHPPNAGLETQTNNNQDREGAQARVAVFDVGGDDVGATALGRYSQHIKSAGEYALIYVVNAYRSQTQTVAEAIEIMHEIESACKLQVTGIVNNSHLRGETTLQTVLDAQVFGEECASAAGVPLLAQTAPAHLYAELTEKTHVCAPGASNIERTSSAQNSSKNANVTCTNFFANEMLVKTPWE